MSFVIASIKYLPYTSSDPQPGFVTVYADTESDLPTVAQLQSAGNVDPLAGSSGIACDTGAEYLLDTGGTWHKRQGETFSNVYTSAEVDALLAGKQDTLTITSHIAQGSADIITAGGVYDAVYYIENNGFIGATDNLNNAPYDSPGRWYYTDGTAKTMINRPNHDNFTNVNAVPGMLEFIQVYKSGTTMRGIQRIYISGARWFMRGYQNISGAVTWYSWYRYEGTNSGILP